MQQVPSAGLKTEQWNDIMCDEDQEIGIAQASIIVISLIAAGSNSEPPSAFVNSWLGSSSLISSPCRESCWIVRIIAQKSPRGLGYQVPGGRAPWALTHFRAVVGLTLAAARRRPVCPWADEPPAARTKLRLVPVQAGPDALDVRNLGAAQAKRVACTRLSPFGRVGMAGRRPNRDRKRRCQHQTELEIPADGKHASKLPPAQSAYPSSTGERGQARTHESRP